jgi:hypothetical protein
MNRVATIRAAHRKGKSKRKFVNPIWTHLIYDAARQVRRCCAHCGKADKYAQKRPGQFYKCKHCGRRFQEKTC